MGKRKLRNCPKCGTRHGPPTGKGCARKEEVFTEEIEENVAQTSEPHVEFENGGDVESSVSVGEFDWASEAASPAKGQSEFPSNTVNREYISPGAFVNYEMCHNGKGRQGEGGGGRQPNFGPRQPQFDGQSAPRPTSEFEKSMSVGMESMENMLGRVAGIQSCRLERLVHLANHPVGSPKASAETKKEDPPKPEAVDSASSLGTDNEDYEWKEYHGAEIWRKEKELKRKNPFDHKAYLAKGEKVDSFERLMSVTFKTISQLLELKSDVKGVVRHGRLMADKAYKKVYHLDAFTGYDVDIRERAARAGPSAFGSVVQEEVLTHCYDNTIKARQQAKPVGKSARQKSEKVCHRFNDAGCQSKSCFYSHKCSGCGDGNHGRRGCKSADSKKDRK